MNTNTNTNTITKAAISAYLKAVEKRKAAEAAEAAAKAALVEALGGAESITAHGYTIANKVVVSSRVDTTAFKAAEPKMAARFTVESVSTRFSVKVAK